MANYAYTNMDLNNHTLFAPSQGRSTKVCAQIELGEGKYVLFGKVQFVNHDGDSQTAAADWVHLVAMTVDDIYSS